MPSNISGQLVKAMFSGLHRRSAATALPEPGTLSMALEELIDQTTESTQLISPSILSLFASAGVEMWHRAVHSFLVSASLTKASPLWSSVSGYYSSHYAIRGLAHLLGYFQLQKIKKTVKVEISGNQFICHIDKKQRRDAEHKFYWMIVKEDHHFSNDPLYTKNDKGKPISDCEHRNKANYADHINKFPRFHVLDAIYLKQRIETISNIVLSDSPIPRVDQYPDVDYVQLIAYHRMVGLREFVDEILGGGNRFWSVHRNPAWSRDFLDFQIKHPMYTNAYMESL